ncbi:hypothetical protein H0H87_006173 [Tephrocybe sp. NHM501043]|nr:hypothetical protein H0H87_006173 [Tephrocybe sp. NHM501043]
MEQLKYASLPLYTPSEPSPTYSCEPSCDERTLQQTPRQSRSTPSGTFIRRSGKITVTFYEQEDGVDMPEYGRRAEIAGSLLIEDPHKVCQVTIKLEGKLDTTIAESGSKTISLINLSQTLWHRGAGEELSGYLAFSLLLPSNFEYEGSERALPPSYRDDRSTTNAFFIRALYTITVSVTRARHNLDFLTRSEEYSPRTRAHRPILPNPGFFSTIKTSPEEWYQTFSTMQTRKPMPELGPIHFHLFVPGARVYGLHDKIPFHIQLNGPLDGLQKLLMPQPANAPPLPSWSARKSREKCPAHTKPKIRVYILRQSHIETRGYKSWRNAPIGEGEVWELPPAICNGSGGVVHLDWAGELKPNADVTVGGFTAGNVTVKDFIVLAVDPPTVDNQPSPYLAVQMTVPIRLVTDSYVEVTEYEPPPV